MVMEVISDVVLSGAAGADLLEAPGPWGAGKPRRSSSLKAAALLGPVQILEQNCR